MRFDAFIFIVLFLTIHIAATYGREVPIIPKPVVSTPVDAEFVLTKATPIIIADSEAEKTGYYLQKELLKHTGIPVTIQDAGAEPAILLSLSTDRDLEHKAYRLTMDAKQIQITSSDEEGLFLGVMSLM